MKFNIRTIFWVLAYSLMAGGSLALFSSITTFVKYLFSLLTVYIGIRFFRRFESIGLRITFVLLSIVLYFLIVIVITTIQYIQDNPLPVQ